MQDYDALHVKNLNDALRNMEGIFYTQYFLPALIADGVFHDFCLAGYPEVLKVFFLTKTVLVAVSSALVMIEIDYIRAV